MNRANRPTMSRISGSSYASKLMSRAGDGSTLSIDFTTGVLDSRITFSRADATARATFINNLGYVTTVSSAQDPRFDYDPTTLQPKGLLIEGSATNLMTYSEDQGNNTTWSAFGTSVTRTTGQTDPGNNSTASKLVFDATTTDAVISRSVTVLNATQYTISMWMRADSGTVTNVRFARSAGSAGAIFPTLTTAWQRVQLTFTSSTTSDGIEIRVLNSGSPKTATVHLWGAQLETGSMSSYIPTVASSVSRAVDTAIIAAGAKFDSWYTGGTTGTFVANWYANASSSTARTVIATNDQTTKHLHMYQTASALTLRLADFNAAATVTTANSMTAGALTKGAFSYNGTATNLCLNGGTVASGTLAFSSAPTWLSIGAPSTNGTSITGTTVVLNNSIRSIKYWPAVLSNATLQSLTA
jgi:hypothetical protein